MEHKDKEEYNGFWKHLGCTLMIVTGCVFLYVIYIILKLIFLR
ncbi:hypothetical protein [uncultured Psychroserpens sp.]|nr:hypothetical protein [uncultured Psychroserpens sp.]